MAWSIMHPVHNFLIAFFFLISAPCLVFAQDTTQVPPDNSEETPVPEQVDANPTASDSAIQERLSSIMAATGWFTHTRVQVKDGVVFLQGTTESEDYKQWAGQLARNTQDVAAVVNQFNVADPDIWDYEPAINGLQELWRNIMRSIPFAIFGLLVLILFWGVSLLAAKVTRASLQKREMNILLQDIAARSSAIIVFLIGVYIVFYIADLTGVAFTVLGGTGLLGIILGIAFRDITENFLASIFLSLQNPFHAGDLVEITGTTGFIQRLTIRATVLMTLDGNHLQIPNSIVYKNSILNFSSNPNQQTRFTIGIGYDDNITQAQEIGAGILASHPAVLEEPEPMVLVDELAASTINLQFYYWIDRSRHELLKVQSSVLRQVKTAFQKHGISMPDEAREMVFPNGVPVQISEKQLPKQAAPDSPPAPSATDDSEVTTQAEGQLQSNAGEIREQARRSRSPEEGEDLLKSE